MTSTDKSLLSDPVTVPRAKWDEYQAWLGEQRLAAIAAQKANPECVRPIYQSCWDAGHPYSGAIGGEITYLITQTSIGLIIKAHYAHTKQEFDFTDYGSW